VIRETLALIEAFRGAYERKDLRAMLELFGAEPRDRGVAGRAALEQLYARNFAALGHVSYELTQLEVHMATAENDILVYGRYRIRATRLAGSPPLDVAGRIGWVLRRESGGLRIARIDYEITPTASAAAGAPVTAASVTGRPETGLPSGVTVHTVPRAEILAVIEGFRGAYERKDLRGMMGLLGSEPRDRNVRGRGALEQLYTRNFAALDQIRYELTQLELQPSTSEGDLVVEGRYRVRAIRVASPSQPIDVAGPIRWLLRREMGTLRIVGIDYDVSVR
jgi:ketosteroid isomerase-like protein